MTTKDIAPITGIEATIARAAVERQRQQQERWSEISRILNLGTRSRMTELFELGETDALVQAYLTDGEYWGAVVDNQRPREWFANRDEALLHLVAVRNDGVTTQAHRYAARVVGVPVTQ